MVPTSLRILYLAAAFSSLLSWGLLAFVFQPPDKTPPPALSVGTLPRVGQVVPDLAFQSPGRGAVSLRDLRGRWILLNFWATWCEPCRREMPSLERLARYFADQGIPFLLLAASVDQSWQDVQQFLQQDPSLRDLRLKMRLVWDKGGQEALRFGTSKFPETYLIDPQGRLQQKFVGPFEWDSPSLLAQIQQRMRPSPR